jgi:hypothetical protein
MYQHIRSMTTALGLLLAGTLAPSLGCSPSAMPDSADHPANPSTPSADAPSEANPVATTPPAAGQDGMGGHACHGQGGGHACHHHGQGGMGGHAGHGAPAGQDAHAGHGGHAGHGTPAGQDAHAGHGAPAGQDAHAGHGGHAGHGTPAGQDAHAGHGEPASPAQDAHAGHGAHDAHGAADAGQQPAGEEPAALLAAEQEALALARPVLDKHCARCHSSGGKKARKNALSHFSMDSYPFGGHHATEIGEEIREVLGVEGKKKATMPPDQPGVVQGDELALVVAWTEAFDRSHAAGLHDHGAGHDHGAQGKPAGKKPAKAGSPKKPAEKKPADNPQPAQGKEHDHAHHHHH